MDAREYISGFSNKELCKEWNNNIPASEFGLDYELYTDSQDIESVMEYFGDFINPSILTGIILQVGDGDYTEVYITESSRPYDLGAIYHPFEYYL